MTYTPGGGMPTPEPESEITGPSSTPLKSAVITTGTVAAPVIRTGVQVISGTFLVQGWELWVSDLPSATHKDWAVIAVSSALAWLQNTVEKRRGRRLVGSNL